MRRILVIDDSRLVLAAMRDALERAGFQVETHESAKVALDRFAEIAPDVVISDLEMPELTGLDVVKHIHAHSPETPVLILTEHGEVPLVVQTMREGGFGYLRKGISDDALVEEINAALKHRAVLEQNRKLQEVTRQYQQKLERMVEEKTAEVIKLQKRQAQTEKMAALGTLLAGVAHEVNNPLAVISGNIQWLQECLDETFGSTDVDELQRELAKFRVTLAEMESSADRIERLVAQLRRLSHPGTEHGECNLRRALQQAAIYCKPHLNNVAELALEIPDELPKIALSEDDVVSVVSNLVVNACHACAAGSGKIRVRVKPDGDWVHVQVIDNGSGINPDHLTQVFDPFFTTKAPGKGSGLGLSLVYQIVTSVGGDVQVQSELKKGTTMDLKLPVSRASVGVSEHGAN